VRLQIVRLRPKDLPVHGLHDAVKPVWLGMILKGIRSPFTVGRARQSCGRGSATSPEWAQRRAFLVPRCLGGEGLGGLG
jgi:hypothetical protein